MIDWDGHQYEQVSSLQRWLAEQSLSGLKLSGHEDLLDVGCGDGFLTRQLAARLPDGTVLGIDPSPRMIEVARSRPIPPGARVRFELGEALDLDGGAAIAADSFDLVVSFNALHWVQDQARALRGVARVLRPAGRALVQFVSAGERTSVEQVAMFVSVREPWAPFFHDFAAPFHHPTQEQFVRWATQAGLTVTELDVADRTWDFGSREAFARWCAVGFASWTARIDPSADSPQPGSAAGAADSQQWVDEVVDDYQTVVGEPGVFRFLQLRAAMSVAS